MPLDESNCAVTYKVLVLGDYSVGKSALLRSLTGDSFTENMRPTVGVDFVRKIFEVDGALVQLAIWDSAGQERFRSITRQQYRGVQGLILVYDITDEKSFETLKYWVQSIQEEIAPPSGQYEPTPFVVCANKADLSGTRTVPLARGIKFSNKEMAFGFYETSAKTGENVYTAFQTLAFHITDICNPKIMKSYHPYLIRPLSQNMENQSEQPKPKKKKKQKKKRMLRFRGTKGNNKNINANESDGVVALDFTNNLAWFSKEASGDRVPGTTKQQINNNNTEKIRKEKKFWKTAIQMCHCFGVTRLSMDET